MVKSTKDSASKRDRPKGPASTKGPASKGAEAPEKEAPEETGPRMRVEHGAGTELHSRLSEGTTQGYLTGQLLIAMPTMMDPRFQRTVIFMCAHDERGAMGLVLNRLIDALTFPELLKQLGIDNAETGERPIHFGGPVDMGRGFVLHSDDYNQDGTVAVTEYPGLTDTVPSWL